MDPHERTDDIVREQVIVARMKIAEAALEAARESLARMQAIVTQYRRSFN